MVIKGFSRITLPHRMRLVFILFFVLIAGIVVINLHFHPIQKKLIPPNSPHNPPVISSLPINWEDLDQRERKYDHIIKAAASRYDINPFLIKAIIHVESQFDHQAVSPRGANGLMQIRPRIASLQGCRDPFDPKENIYAGVGHLRSLLDFFEGDQNLALAAYNAGMSQVLIYKGVPPFKETRYFVHKVLSSFHYFSQKEKG